MVSFGLRRRLAHWLQPLAILWLVICSDNGILGLKTFIELDFLAEPGSEHGHHAPEAALKATVELAEFLDHAVAAPLDAPLRRPAAPSAGAALLQGAAEQARWGDVEDGLLDDVFRELPGAAYDKAESLAAWGFLSPKGSWARWATDSAATWYLSRYGTVGEKIQFAVAKAGRTIMDHPKLAVAAAAAVVAGTIFAFWYHRKRKGQAQEEAQLQAALDELSTPSGEEKAKRAAVDQDMAALELVAARTLLVTLGAKRRCELKALPSVMSWAPAGKIIDKSRAEKLSNLEGLLAADSAQRAGAYAWLAPLAARCGAEGSWTPVEWENADKLVSQVYRMLEPRPTVPEAPPYE